MITKDAMMSGLINYIDAEVIPNLPQSGKWIAGTAVFLFSAKASEVMDSLLNNSIVRAVGVVDEEGYIDHNRLFAALSKSASKYGKMSLSIPMVGNIRFCSDDVDVLKRYVDGGAVCQNLSS